MNEILDKLKDLKGKPQAPKKTNGPFYTSKRGLKEMAERAMLRDSERREQEKKKKASREAYTKPEQPAA